MENSYIPFTTYQQPVEDNTYVQLKLSNGNEPINKASVFTWGAIGRGVVYPHILGYRVVSEKEYNEYQERVANFRKEIKT
jgi:hypothetical protein